jgi:hypothetical protein
VSNPQLHIPRSTALKRTLAAAIAASLITSISGCTLIAAGVASGASDDGSAQSTNDKAPVIRLENDIRYSEPAGRREKQ